MAAPSRVRPPVPIEVQTRGIEWARAQDPAWLAAPLAPDSWRVHLLDVGTGLSILVQGADFAMLYDAGTRDRSEPPTRVTAYLAAVLGGDCDTHRPRLDHVVLSHPHEDHASALPAVLRCHEVTHVWEPGRVHEAVFYREFVEAVAATSGTTYHTAAGPPSDRTVVIRGEETVVPKTVPWVTFSEGDEVALGHRASFRILHADAKRTGDPNDNSLVLAVDLGETRLLLVGDAESGPRASPRSPVGGVEAALIADAAAWLDADLLQVGHHGSSTSSRAAFLAAVSPSLALVSAGPYAYRGVVLPDADVIDALVASGATVLRTDAHDDACDWQGRLGGDVGPGGCDGYVITISE